MNEGDAVDFKRIATWLEAGLGERQEPGGNPSDRQRPTTKGPIS
jgi:hypothetical protein